MAREDSKTMDFQPIDYDASELPPEAQPGAYEATCTSLKVTKTQKESFPMLIVEWTLDAVDGEGDENSVGATIADFVTFFPAKHKAGRMSIQRFRALVDAAGIDPDVLPQRLTSKNDFAELISALRNKKMTVYIFHQLDKRTNEQRASVSYTAPKGSLSNGLKDETDDDDDKPRKAAPKKGRR